MLQRKDNLTLSRGFQLTTVLMVHRFGGVVTSRLEIINGVGALLSEQAVEILASQPGVIVTQNTQMRVDSAASAPQTARVEPKNPETNYPDVVGADAVWAAGVTGQGVTVAFLDTGLTKLSGLVKPGHGKGVRVLAWQDFVNPAGRGKFIDPNGHGTHVAGIVANSDKGNDGEWNGVAPNVNLVSGVLLMRTVSLPQVCKGSSG
jgi:serine protease AprX